MTYREAYQRGRELLKSSLVSDADIDSKLLLQYVCKTDSSALFAAPDYVLTAGEEDTYFELITQRSNHVPLQHLTGSQGFMGLDFCVNKNVLIPRSDTETLVEEVLKNLHDGMRILDMCTGSGCILISLLHYSNDCEGVGADLSPKALEVAKINAEKNNVEAFFIESDLFENIEGKFDIIVSNPPYIKTSEISGLMPEVRDFDPLIALDGKEDGLSFYRRILEEGSEYLKEGGMLFFEIGEDQGESVSRMMKERGFLGVEVIKDLCGNDRVVSGRKRINV